MGFTGYILNDNFNGSSATLPNTATWTCKNEVGTPDFGPTDTEFYVSNTSIISTDGAGNLVIKVGTQATDGASAGTWPSGRCDTGHPSANSPTPSATPQYAVQVGQSCEIRMKLNTLAGTWPAIWFLGVNSVWTGNYCEIDLAENYGSGLQDCTVWAAVNGDPTWTLNGNPNQLAYHAHTNAVDANYHTFRLDMLTNEIQLWRDGVLAVDITAAAAQAAFPLYTWNFGTIGGMYVILNVATSSSVTGTNPSAGALPASIMTVDYVRIWAPAGPDPNTFGAGNLITPHVAPKFAPIF